MNCPRRVSKDSELPERGGENRTGTAGGLRTEDFRTVLEQIYSNRYFTNHGPLAREFEERWEQFLDVGHAVAVGNDELALLIAMASLQLCGCIHVPDQSGSVTPGIAHRLKLTVRTYETAPGIPRQFWENGFENDGQPNAIVLDKSWMRSCDPDSVRMLLERDIRVIVLADDALELAGNGVHRLIRDPGIVSVCSLGAGRTLTTLQGGVIATNDGEFADRCRNMRSSYGRRAAVDVMATCNGRFSEFQAGLGLRCLERLKTESVRQSLASELH